MLCIALGLGLLACYFPADGIRVAGIDLRFPSLHDVLAKEEPVVEAEEPEIVELSPEELTERFVRGDVSRNSEGSGLGLSIAESLTELQKGEFRVDLDGDLFKVTLDFERMK